MKQCPECPFRKGATNAGGISKESVIQIFPLGTGCHMRTVSGIKSDWIKPSTPKCIGSLELARAVFI